MPYQRFTPGMPLGGNLKASFLNDVGDAVDAVRRNKRTGEQPTAGRRPESICKVSNKTETWLTQFRPFFIDGPSCELGEYNEPNPTGCEEVSVKAGTWPESGGEDAWKAKVRWGVALENIAKDTAGDGCVGGVTIAIVLVKDEKHTTCGVNLVNTQYLHSGEAGATILYCVGPIEENGSEKLCIIRIESGGMANIPARITGADRETGRYSFKELEFDGESWGEKTNGLTGDHEDDDGYAVEETGSVDVLKGTDVQLWPSGYNSVYRFKATPGVITCSTVAIGADTSAEVNVGDLNGYSNDDITAWNDYQYPIEVADGARMILGWSLDGRWVVVSQECEQS